MAAPASVSIAPHPSMFNRALRDLGVDSVTVAERGDGSTYVTLGNESTSELVNALVIAHTRLLAAESNVSGIERALAQLRLVTGLQGDDRIRFEEACEELANVSTNLTGLTRVER